MNLKRNIFNIIIVMLLIALCAGAVLLNNKIQKIENQLSYTADNTSVILSDVETMQSDIETTLEEEASLISDWKITLKSADFSAKTYTVDISVVPKEYTSDTVTSVYFGTDEIPLTLDGIKFTGEATLPLSESYAGNVTFLFVDGDKRSTEVLDDFKGVISVFDNVASGIISAQPEVSDGNIKLLFDLDAVILNNDYFDFSKYELVVASGQTDIRSYDLEQLASQQETKNNLADDSQKEDSENTEDDTEAVDDYEHGFEGTVKIDDTAPAVAGENIKLYLRVTSAQGYTFTYDLFSGNINQDVNGFDTVDEIDKGNYTVIDSNKSVYQKED